MNKYIKNNSMPIEDMDEEIQNYRSEKNEQLLRLRKKVLQAEQERVEGTETIRVPEAKARCNK